MEDYENKYKNALEWARQVVNGKIGFVRDEVQEIFPELAEPEDERIKGAIIDHLKDNNLLEWADWLEKQRTDPYNGVCFYCYGHRWDMCARDNGIEIVMDGKPVRHFSYKDCEQTFGGKSAREAINEVKVDNSNSVNNTPYDYENANINQKDFAPKEPKFHPGDWIINRTNATIMQIVDNKDFYESVELNGQRRTDTYQYVDWDFRLWTIEDAKVGDVLVIESGRRNNECLFIFKDIAGREVLEYSYYRTSDNTFSLTGSYIGYLDNIYHPATKEQCGLFFQKMKEEGYEWDAEKKELREIEQNPAWSEEDEKRLKSCLNILQAKGMMGAAETINTKWLKSLKERIWK